MLTGPPLGTGRQDILREPWFLGTLLGCVGGLLWLGLCIVSVWLYRRRKAVAGRKLKNMAAYSGNRHSSSSCCRELQFSNSCVNGRIWRGVVVSVVDGSIAEWLACWTRAQKARVQIAVATLLRNSLRQTVHTHRASVCQAAKLVAALLRVAGVTEGQAESNGSLPSGS